ncbi:MAG: ABC transporter substrate-binding protein [Acholeplasmataceae bacterium]|nr:ABC transporter substrate-binding protein [Acholeplasmataceae bacterium]
MKRLMTGFVLLFVVIGLVACSSQPRLKVYMPGEYIDQGLVDAFEDAFDVKVDVITFDSNESAIPQIQANSYDVIIPSDYAIEELVEKDLLLEIDLTKLTSITNSDYAPGLKTILDELKNAEDGFDLLAYGVPYFWGNVGILYDASVAGLEALLETNGWEALKDPAYDVMFYDSSRDSFMIALKSLGASMNTPTTQELADAESWLLDAAGNPNVLFLTDEVLDDMLDPARHDMAVVYSGDAVYLMYENSQLGYYVPQEGTNVWVDAFAIPKNANDVDLAYEFINFMTTYDAMLANTIEVAYTSPRQDVIDEIIATEEYDVDSYVVTVGPNDEVFRYNTDLKRAIEEAWARVRSS